MGENQIHCIDCGRAYPESGAPYRCPDCGGLFDFSRPLTFDPAQVDSSRRGVFRFSSTFLPASASDSFSLGEGNTPLIWNEAFGRKVAFKCEYQNPSGSFKDRGTASLIAFLKSRGVTDAVEDSSGNAGASFAAYAARAGIKARVLVPESASGPKRKQIEAYGAELVPIPGPRSRASEAAEKAAQGGAIYASHAYLPFNLPGYATIAYEIHEQLGRAPGAVIVPAGQGGLLLGAWRGFEALNQAGALKEAPMMIGVQAQACSPLVSQKSRVEGQTLAEGVKVANPLRAKAVQEAVVKSGGIWVRTAEKDILPGRDALARRGFYVEPTSALVWTALKETLSFLPDPVVVILTGAGLKFSGT
ncbi:MAG: Threonine synthase [Anaerolineales bacterium]|nr:Threonine synthase [Anaerolineales bacterium]